jgi:peptidoglycan/xylan/chitin deacetylase (PgdA/CDA1 family)
VQQDFSRHFVSLTFDDGYRDNLEYALPILERHKAPFTMFVATSFPDRLGELWWVALERVVAATGRIVVEIDGKERFFYCERTAKKYEVYAQLYWWLRSLSDEKLSNGDRVLVALRGAFILDRCCQPLDGVNVCGFVPILPDEHFRRFHKPMPGPVCDRDPYGPPRSGIGIPGGSTFESWFYVRRRDEGGHHMTEHYDDHGLAKGE